MKKKIKMKIPWSWRSSEEQKDRYIAAVLRSNGTVIAASIASMAIGTNEELGEALNRYHGSDAGTEGVIHSQDCSNEFKSMDELLAFPIPKGIPIWVYRGEGKWERM